ncbi:MAG: hypothetical protein NT129_01875 [Candidatus Aenigmarchaeota archaeon]|nr:hypothetical protein [Candidatus Aenigmarchaeota archaeon]
MTCKFEDREQGTNVLKRNGFTVVPISWPVHAVIPAVLPDNYPHELGQEGTPLSVGTLLPSGNLCLSNGYAPEVREQHNIIREI